MRTISPIRRSIFLITGVLLVCVAFVEIRFKEIQIWLYGDWELLTIDGVAFNELKNDLGYEGQETPNLSVGIIGFSGYDGCNWFNRRWNETGIMSTDAYCGDGGLMLPLAVWELENHLLNATVNSGVLSVPGTESYPPSTYTRR